MYMHRLIFFALACLASAMVGHSMQIYTLNLGSPDRVSLADEGVLCHSDRECDRLEQFECSSLDGPFCGSMAKQNRSKKSPADLNEVLGKLLKSLKEKRGPPTSAAPKAGQTKQTKQTKQPKTNTNPFGKSASQSKGRKQAQAPTKSRTTGGQSAPASLDEVLADPQLQQQIKQQLQEQLKGLLGDQLDRLGDAAELDIPGVEAYVMGADGEVRRFSTDSGFDDSEHPGIILDDDGPPPPARRGEAHFIEFDGQGRPLDPDAASQAQAKAEAQLKDMLRRKGATIVDSHEQAAPDPDADAHPDPDNTPPL